MRSLGYSTILAAALVVAPACSKKDEPAAADDKKADAGDAKSDEKTEAGDKATPEAGIIGADKDAPTAGAAPGGFPSTLSLIPDQAQFLIGVRPKDVMASPVYALMKGEIEQDPELQKTMRSLADCNLDPAKVESVVVGANMNEDIVMVVVADGVGEAENAKCLISKMQDGAAAPEVVEQDGKKQIQLTDARAYLIDGRTMAVASASWQDALGQLIDGKGEPAASNSKKDLLARVNGATAVWGVGDLPAEFAQMGAMFGAPPEIADVKAVTGSIDMSSGAGINIVAVFNDAAKAKATADKLQTMLQNPPPEAAELVKLLKIEAADTDLTMSLSMSMDDITKASQLAPVGAPAPM